MNKKCAECGDSFSCDNNVSCWCADFPKLSKNEIDDKNVDKLFEKIDRIITQGYEKLSSKEKDQLNILDTELDELFDQLDDDEVNSYPS